MNFKIESGHSMVEMLGTLAIIGVLSIGGIAGYSYGMDKYRANQTMHEITLRAIDLMAQASQGREELSLAEWKNESTIYEFGTPIYTEDDLIQLDVGNTNNPISKNICEMIFDGMKSNALYIDINGQETEVNPVCSNNNTMTFYFEGGGSQMDICSPACADDEYCDNGLCFKGDRPEGTALLLDTECTIDDDCNKGWIGSCAYCDTLQGKCLGDAFSNGSNCTITDKAIDGQCSMGKCVARECTYDSENQCAPGYFCQSPNTSCYTAFNTNEKGVCQKSNLAFKYKKIGKQEYYISNTVLSWWDADAGCKSLGKELIEIDDLIKDEKETTLAKELQNSIMFTWTKTPYNDCRYWYADLYVDRTIPNHVNRNTGYYMAVCK